MIHKEIRYGQASAYQDSVYEYEIDPQGATEEEVLAYCQKLRPSPNRHADDHYHNGSCGFPFGLWSFYSLKKLSSGFYRYSVTEPFCD